MKPTGQRWHLRSQNELTGFVEWVNHQWQAGHQPTVQMMKDARSSNQNRYIHGIYDVAAKKLGQTMVEMTRDCKLRYGVPILRAADPEFSEMYDTMIKKNLTFEQKLVLMDYLPVTSEFNAEQATQYIDTLLMEFSKQGVFIQDPRK